MTTGDNTKLPVLGSLNRTGREDPAYQQDRLQMLCRFALRLAQAHDQQTRNVWKEIYKLGRSWDDQRKIIESQKNWIGVLEGERDRLQAEAQRLGKEWESQVAALGESKSQVSSLSDQLAQVAARISELEARLAGLERELDTRQKGESQLVLELQQSKEESRQRLAVIEAMETQPLYRLLRRFKLIR